MKATAGDLAALAGFLDGLADLSSRTGVEACVYSRDYVRLPNGEAVQIGSVRDAEGNVTYAVEEDQ